MRLCTTLVDIEYLITFIHRELIVKPQQNNTQQNNVFFLCDFTLPFDIVNTWCAFHLSLMEFIDVDGFL